MGYQFFLTRVLHWCVARAEALLQERNIPKWTPHWGQDAFEHFERSLAYDVAVIVTQSFLVFAEGGKAFMRDAW